MIALGFALAVCACGAGGGSPAPQDASDGVTGRVRVAGNTPFEQVLIEPDVASDAVEVRGEYRDELRHLSGATVRASGSFSGEHRFEVSGYEILKIAGQEPFVGVLDLREGDLLVRSVDGEVKQIRSPSAELVALAGAKVWVILDSNGAMKGYGVIRER